MAETLRRLSATLVALLADRDQAAPFPPNTMLDDKYRLDELLEVGGMGAVYAGTHTKLQKKVAIKVLRRELADSPDMIERFQREAVAASRIGHESIVDVSDLGTTRDGSPFLVMEFLVGETLAARIRDVSPMNPTLACAIAREILDAIAAAHRAGIIHRDLKPENVFLVRGSRGESVKILDFGISRVIEARAGTANDARLTATGQVMGTPYYMAPEQAAGQSDINGAVDVYATGVILYEMLAGDVPFDAGNYNTIIFKVLSGQFEPLATRVGGLPPQLDAIVSRAMALRPEDRFGSADELASALAPFASAAMSTSQPLPLSAAAADPSGNVGFAPTMTPRDLAKLPSAIVARTQFATTTAQQAPNMHAPNMGTPVHPALDSSGRGRKFALLGAIIVLLAGAGVAAALLLQADEAPVNSAAAETAEAAETAPAPAQAPATTGYRDVDPKSPSGASTGPNGVPNEMRPPAPAPAEEVSLSFEVSPRGATVWIDGKRVKGDYVAEKSDREIEIVVKRRGYETKTRTYRLDQSRAIEVVLKKRRKAGGKKADKKGKRIIGDSPYD